MANEIPIDNFCTLDPSTADNVARLLEVMIGRGDVFTPTDSDDAQSVANALYALGNDTDAILCAQTYPT